MFEVNNTICAQCQWRALPCPSDETTPIQSVDSAMNKNNEVILYLLARVVAEAWEGARTPSLPRSDESLSNPGCQQVCSMTPPHRRALSGSPSVECTNLLAK